MIVKYVPSQQIAQIFNSVEGFIKDGLDYSDDFTVDQAKMCLLNGSMDLFVVVDDGDLIHGVFVISTSNGANDRTSIVVSAGGKGIANNQVFDQVCEMLKRAGVTRVQALARESAARLYEQVGFKKKSILTEKRL